MFFYDTYARVAGFSLLAIVGGSVGLALVFTWITMHNFGKHEDMKIVISVIAAIVGVFLLIFLAFRMMLPV